MVKIRQSASQLNRNPADLYDYDRISQPPDAGDFDFDQVIGL
jgi:hypothetical protein